GIGHNFIHPVPSLFTFNLPCHPITQLYGISVDPVSIKIVSSKFMETGPLMITHWGFCGPAILRLSAWVARKLNDCNYQFMIALNWLPYQNDETLRKAFQEIRFKFASQKMQSRNPFGLPSRLWEFLMTQAEIPLEIRWSDLPSKGQNKLIKLLVDSEYSINGKTTFKEEFVTCGGIDLDHVNPMTMESKKHPGLFFAGEILDIDGITGGFNFQHAWSSGWIAASSISKRFKSIAWSK
ncbi:MAG: aminoacetone oxidase family FAD-binding enzyme, partial [Chitinophagaceae bacterium]